MPKHFTIRKHKDGENGDAWGVHRKDAPEGESLVSAWDSREAAEAEALELDRAVEDDRHGR